MKAHDVHREDAEAVRLVASVWFQESRKRKDLADELVWRIKAEAAAEIADHIARIGSGDMRELEDHQAEILRQMRLDAAEEKTDPEAVIVEEFEEAP